MKLLIEVLQDKTGSDGITEPMVIDVLDFTAQGIDGQTAALETMKAKYPRLAMCFPVTTFRLHKCGNDEHPSKPCVIQVLS